MRALSAHFAVFTIFWTIYVLCRVCVIRHVGACSGLFAHLSVQYEGGDSSLDVTANEMDIAGGFPPSEHADTDAKDTFKKCTEPSVIYAYF